MKTSIRRPLAAATLAFALAAGPAACGDDTDHGAGHDNGAAASSAAPTPASTTPSADAAAVDAAFVRQMVPHHQMAVQMAEQVQPTARHDEIRDLADEIIRAQNAEIETLRELAADLDVELASAGAKQAADAKTLGLAADDLGMDAHAMHGGELSERAFIDGMIPHHEGAIEMAKAQLAAGEDPGVKRLSTAIIAAQAREIAQLKAWRGEWYGGEPVDAAPPTSHAHGGEHE